MADINFAIMGPAARTIHSQNYNGIYEFFSSKFSSSRDI